MIRFITVLACLALLAGCSKPYVITTSLVEPLAETSCVQIAEIQDLLPDDTEESDRPSAEDIGKFKVYLVEEFASHEKLSLEIAGEGCPYEVQGSLLTYKKGSGLVRWLVGFGAGNAKVVTELRLVDTRDGSTLFGGNFTGEVGSWMDSGDRMFKMVSGNFVKQLEKQVANAKPES